MFDTFRDEFNTDRPHEGLGMKYPAQLYATSKRLFPNDLPDPEYPLHDLTRTVLSGGFIQVCRFRGKLERFHLGQAFTGQKVGLREEESGLWRVTFMKNDLGFYGADKGKFQPFENPICVEN